MRVLPVLLATVVCLTACSETQAPVLETSQSVAANRSAEHVPFITTALVTRDWHSCATAMGGLRCWGWNSDGQLGNGETGTMELSPVLVEGPRFSQVSVGGFHSCALDAAGVAYCWGNNTRGGLGTGDLISRSEPVQVATDVRFSTIRVGNHFTCALTADGVAMCWGGNNNGQLGTPTTTTCTLPSGTALACSAVPVPVAGGHVLASLDVGLFNGCGLTADGSALCWGNNLRGQLGRGTVGDPSHSPLPVSGGLSFSQVSVGASHVCAIATDGTTYCWGDNVYGQLGTGDHTRKLVPTVVASGDVRFAAIRASSGNSVFSFSCGATASGELHCWGANSLGQLGHSAPLPTCGVGSRARPCSTLPMPVDTELRFQSFETGFEVVCAVSTQQRGYCWGSNEFGALGNASVAVSTSTPTPIAATPGRARGRQGPPAGHVNHLTIDE